MRVKIAKWGNSAAIRLPKAVMEGLKVDEGAEIELSLVEGELRGIAIRSGKRASLEQLVAEMKRLGGADYDFGAEEWDVLPTELGEYGGFHDGE